MRISNGLTFLVGLLSLLLGVVSILLVLIMNLAIGLGLGLVTANLLYLLMGDSIAALSVVLFGFTITPIQLNVIFMLIGSIIGLAQIDYSIPFVAVTESFAALDTYEKGEYNEDEE